MGGEGERGYVPENADVEAAGYMTAKRVVERLAQFNRDAGSSGLKYDAENNQERIVAMVNEDLANKGREVLSQDSQDAIGNAISLAYEDGELDEELLQEKLAEVVSAHLEKAGAAE